ncbi:MAG: hypothetical protein NWF14_06070 [Candidatus Bathyarchaeota archaeon]|nr:hypothetical protein [Candidatus Bathyarchaeota archaeon]
MYLATPIKATATTITTATIIVGSTAAVKKRILPVRKPSKVMQKPLV